MNNQPKHDIFISYCRKDIEAVKAFKQEIEATTLATCWMDLDGIESGNPKFTKIIINAINSCPIFLFMLTEASQQSENALKELDFAYKKHREEGKKVVIVYLTPCKMNDEFSFDYAKADTIDWQNPLQREKLTRDLKEWTGYEKKVAGLKEEEEKRRRQKEEQEKARQEQEAARAAKLKEVDERMAALKASLEVCESEQTDLTAKIDEAKKQISDYEATLKVLDATKKDLHAQIAECEKEKKTLLAGGKKKEEKKATAIDEHTGKQQLQSANPLDSKFLRFIDKEQKQILKCATQRHVLVNVVLIMLNILSSLAIILFTLCVFVIDRTEEVLPTMCFILAYSIFCFAATYQSLKNRKEGVIGLIIIFSLSFLPGLLLFLFKKDNKNLWSISKPIEKGLNRNLFTIIFSALILTSITAGIYYSGNLKNEISINNNNIEEVTINNKEKKDFVLEGHKNLVISAAFSPDGKKIVSAADDETLRIWDISDL